VAKDRVQVPDLYKDRGYLPSISPTASPVDTFIRPSQPKGDRRLLELAGAWSEVQPGLTQFANERVAVNNEGLTEEGRKAALANKAQFKEAVQSGQIPAGASPWFKVGYERQKATRTALEYDQAMKAAYSGTNLSDNDDPKAISTFMADFTTKWMEANPDAKSNPEFGSIFSVMGAKSQDALQTIHAVERTKRIEEGLIDDTGFMLRATLDNSVDLLGNRNPTLGADLAQLVDDQVAVGLSGPMANKLVADEVIRKAVEEGDITLLDVLDDVPSGSGTVGKVGYVRDAVSQARDQIASESNRRDRRANAKAEENHKAAIQGLQSSALAKIFQDPFADIDQETDQLTLIDPDKAMEVVSWRTSLFSSLNAQKKNREDDMVKTDLVIRATRNDLTETEVMGALARGEIDAADAKSLITDIMPRTKAAKGILGNPFVLRSSSGLKRIIEGDEESGEFRNVRIALAEQAEEMFLMGMMSFSEKNPQATDKEFIQESSELRQAILDIPEFNPGGTVLPNVAKTLKEDAPVKIDASVPKRVRIFKDASELKAAMAEFAKTGGKSGRLKDLAASYKTTPTALFDDQFLLLSTPE